MSDNIIRITCVKDNCGTFPMDNALYRKLKQTGDSFTCPAGHEQHFGGSPLEEKQERINSLKQKIDQLEDRLEQYREQRNEANQDYWDATQRIHRLETLLLENVAGVVEVDEDSWKWSCKCGSHGQKAFDTEEEARDRYERHLRRADCGHNVSEVTIEQ